MPPSPIPAPLPPWARVLVQLSPFIAAGLQEALDHIGELFDSADPSPSAWMHIQMIGNPTGSVERADDFVTTMDVVNITGGGVDSSWTGADTQAVMNDIGPLLNAWAGQMSSDYRWREVRFYKRFFNPYGVVEPFARTGPPQIVYPFVVAGLAAAGHAPQVAVTTTDRTAYPRHWGRNYWPHPSGTVYEPGGFIPNANVDAIAAALNTCYTALQAAEFYPVVPVTQVDKVATRGLLTVEQIQVDNLYDVIRRRRPPHATYKKLIPA